MTADDYTPGSEPDEPQSAEEQNAWSWTEDDDYREDEK